MAIEITRAEADTLLKTPLISKLLIEWIKGEESEKFPLANLANASAILFENLKQVNWAGFYLYDEKVDELILGPFLRKPAVVRIKPGSGVVGESFEKQETITVADVHVFDGHIACDPASNAEIVVPLTTPMVSVWVSWISIQRPSTVSGLRKRLSLSTSLRLCCNTSNQKSLDNPDRIELQK